MTIEEYRTSKDVSLPKNMSGLQCPQLIDDLWEARQSLIEIRNEATSIKQSCCIDSAIARLNRSLLQLGIDY